MTTTQEIDAAEVRAFCTARLAEDEQQCLDGAPARRYHDPEWGLGLVAVMRDILVREPRSAVLRPEYEGMEYGIEASGSGGAFATLGVHGRIRLPWTEFEERYCRAAPPTRTELQVAAVWDDHPAYQPAWRLP